jgi:chromate transporter
LESDNNKPGCLAAVAAADGAHSKDGTINPRSPTDLFWSFSMLALQGFGGVMAVAQRELVERKRWMTRQEFLGEWAVAQIMPGPNIINLALMLGDRHFGLRGALAGFAGMVTFPLVILLLIALVFSSVENIPAVQGGLRGMGGAVIGLIAANAIKLVGGLKGNVMGTTLCALQIVLTFVAVALLRVPLMWVVLLVGGAGWAWAWLQLRRIDAMKGAA